MAALHNNKLLSQLVKEYPITLFDVKESGINLVVRLAVKLAATSSIVLLGDSGIGKTQLAHAWPSRRTTSVRMDWNIHPSLKMATCLDLFRGESGERSTPYVFDDGCLATQGAEVMKAFLDVAAENPQIKAKYNSCGFIKHQLRVCCNNSFDPAAEDKSEGGQGFITYKSFLKLLEVAFPPGINVVDVKAMMKRATWVVLNLVKGSMFGLPASERNGSRCVAIRLDAVTC
eukprot:2257156-Amphidinium_carterae.2